MQYLLLLKVVVIRIFPIVVVKIINTYQRKYVNSKAVALLRWHNSPEVCLRAFVGEKLTALFSYTGRHVNPFMSGIHHRMFIKPGFGYCNPTSDSSMSGMRF